MTEDEELLQWMEEEAKIEENRRENKVGYSRKGYHGHLFNLCIFLKENKQQSPAVTSLLQDPRFLYVTSILVDQEASDEEKLLGGLTKKPTVHPIIMHDKEVVPN